MFHVLRRLIFVLEKNEMHMATKSHGTNFSFMVSDTKKHLHLFTITPHLFLVKQYSDRLSLIKWGVPQGSILGPIMFPLYVLLSGYLIHRYHISFLC